MSHPADYLDMVHNPPRESEAAYRQRMTANFVKLTVDAARDPQTGLISRSKATKILAELRLSFDMAAENAAMDPNDENAAEMAEMTGQAFEKLQLMLGQVSRKLVANPRNAYQVVAHNLVYPILGGYKMIFERVRVLGTVNSIRRARSLADQFMRDPALLDVTVNIDKNGEGVASYTKRWHSDYNTAARERAFRAQYPQGSVVESVPGGGFSP